MSDSTIERVHKLMEGLKKYNDYPIVQKILSECFDNKSSSDTSQPSFVPDLNEPTIPQPLQEDETV